MRKLKILIFLLFIIFSVFLLTVLLPKNYKTQYDINKVNVTEEYNKTNKVYYFNMLYKKINYPFYINSSYDSKRKLLKDIKVIEQDNIVCLNVDYKDNTYPLCSKDGVLTDYRLLNDTFLNKFFPKLKKDNNLLNTTYEKIKVYNNSEDIVVYNYKALINISNDKKEKIDLFKKDHYDNELTYQNNRYLLIPYYDQEYFFHKLFFYDSLSNTLNDINFDYEISYDSYFMGYEKNCFYLMDRKNKTEYSINIKKSEVTIVATGDKKGKYLNNGVWEDLSLIKLSTKDYYFQHFNLYNYTIKDNKLYLYLNNNKILIDDNNVSKIVYCSNDTVYYLKKDKLYKYSIKDGTLLLLEYSEWNFNSNNKIFTFINQYS